MALVKIIDHVWKVRTTVEPMEPSVRGYDSIKCNLRQNCLGLVFKVNASLITLLVRANVVNKKLLMAELRKHTSFDRC